METYRVVVKDYRITQCKEFDTDDEFMWQVLGSSRRNIPLLEARYEDGTVVDGTNKSGENAGIGTTPFYLVFGEDWFARPIALVA